MRYTLLALACVLFSTGLALPNQTPPEPSCKVYTDNFDAKVAPDSRNSVGTYNGITYQPFVFAPKDAVTEAVAGVVPHSGSNDILAAFIGDATSGSVALNPFGTILASPSKAFDLYSFWFGCSENLQQDLSTSSGCVLSVIGFTVAGQELPVVTYSYAPTNPTAAPMDLAVLPSYYRGLKNVTIGLASAQSEPATTLFGLDDVSHCNYS